MSKSFGGPLVLDDVSLRLERGEIVGLLGHNGSGKSTFIKCLAGYHQPDRLDDLAVYGVPVDMGDLGKAEMSHHVGFVHQDLGLIDDLSVSDNFLLANLRDATSWHINWPAHERRCRRALEAFGLSLPLDAKVGELAQAERCLLAIVRTLDRLGLESGERVLVLDEPTPFLSAEGVERLFALMRDFAGRGGSIVFVAHDIDEVLAITDRIMVLRDGRQVADFRTAEVAREAVVEAIVGQSVTLHAHRAGTVSQDEAGYRVEGLSGNGIAALDLAIPAGRIVGITGLIGSGADAVAEMLAGASPPEAGRLVAPEGAIDLTRTSVDQQMRRGICLLPDDRLRKSGAGELSLADNIVLPHLGGFFRKGFLDRGAMAAHVKAVVERSAVLPPLPGRRLGEFSGGNQQKALMAKWAALAPKLFILSEPTQGVDVGARQGLYRIMADCAAQGAAILVYSSDAAELAQICDIVHVLHEGAVAAVLEGEAISKDAITASMLDRIVPPTKEGDSNARHH